MVRTHVTTPIEQYHFTPFATLLLHIPLAVNEVVREATKIYYEYRPNRNSLEVTLFYVERHIGGEWKMGHRLDFEFTRTAYSYADIKSIVKESYDDEREWVKERFAALSTKSVDNSSTDKNV